MANKVDYFDLNYFVSLLLAIFPVTAWICGVVTRYREKNMPAVIIRIIFGWLIWLGDLLFMIMNEEILRVF